MRKALLWTALIIALLVRLYGITSPLLDKDDWRQVDTASIAVNFMTQSFDVLRPQLMYDGPFPNVIQLELQVTPTIIALLSYIFGYSDTLARLVPVAFALGTVYFLFRLVERWFDQRTAFVASLLYSIMPLAVFYTRTVQPESATLFFSVGALFWVDRALDSSKWRDRILALLFIVMVPLSKLTAIFIFLPILHLVWLRYRTRIKGYIPVAIAMLLSLGIAAWYYKWLEGVAEQKFVTGITQKHLIPEILALFNDLKAAKFLWASVGVQILTPIGIVLLLIGIYAVWKKRLHPVVLSWFVATLVYAFTVGAVIKYNYYMTLVAPAYGILMAVGLIYIARQFSWGKITSVAAFVVVIAMSIHTIRPWYDVEWWIVKAGQAVQEHTPTNALVLAGDTNPTLLFYSRRAGYRTPQYTTEPADIEKFRLQGAQYYLPTQRYGMFQRTKDYLAQYKQIKANGYTFYDLTHKANE